jgi:hypothetical protein
MPTQYDFCFCSGPSILVMIHLGMNGKFRQPVYESLDSSILENKTICKQATRKERLLSLLDRPSSRMQERPRF